MGLLPAGAGDDAACTDCKGAIAATSADSTCKGAIAATRAAATRPAGAAAATWAAAACKGGTAAASGGRQGVDLRTDSGRPLYGEIAGCTAAPKRTPIARSEGARLPIAFRYDG